MGAFASWEMQEKLNDLAREERKAGVMINVRKSKSMGINSGKDFQ